LQTGSARANDDYPHFPFLPANLGTNSFKIIFPGY
jgi:hypothetical protein